ncbi:MAG: LuxR C-terminal-related transcriptional regulator [Phycisphaerales bacterium]|nr:response regulator transcription factor [Planctomycetota bacterium]
MTAGPSKDVAGSGGELPNSQLLALGAALGSDPMSGVAIFGPGGLVMFANVQLSKMFRGPQASPAQSVGKKLAEVYPETYAKEILSVIDRSAETGKPALMRTIWRGEQIYSWVQPIMGEADETPPIGKWRARQVLAISRKVQGDQDARDLFPGMDFEKHDTNVIGLGPLDVLSTRELEVLALLGQGLSAAEIAEVLHRSVKTINTHRESIGKKLKIDDRVKLAAGALRAGLRLTDAARARV